MMPIRPYGLGLGLSRTKLGEMCPQLQTMGKDGKITVCYPDHHKVFTERVWDLFTKERRVDLNLSAQPTSGGIRVHRLILELFIPHLSSLLGEEEATLLPHETGGLDLAAAIGSNHCVKNLMLLIEFVYRGTVDVSVEQLEVLKKIAARLKVPLEVDMEATAARKALPVEPIQEPLIAPNGATVVLQGARKVQRVQTNKRRLTSIQTVESVIVEHISDMEFVNKVRKATIESLNVGTTITRSKRAPRKDSGWRSMETETEERDIEQVTVDRQVMLLPTMESDETSCQMESGIDPSAMVSVVQYSGTTTADVPESDGGGGGSNDEDDNSSGNPEEEVSMLSCPLCDYETPYQRRYDSHVRVKHDPGKVLLKCDRCDRLFVTRAGLKRHLPSHEGDQETYDCSHCTYTTNRKANFLRHMVGTHNRNADGEPVPPRFHCDVCSFTCTYQSQLISHVVHEHSAAAAPFKCPVPDCTYASIRPSNLQKHVNTMHLKFKAVMCDICGRRFSDRSALDVHVRIHTNERPYHCEKIGCEKSFRDHQGLKRHSLSHGTCRPFVCHMCAYACKLRYNLRAHLKRVHNTTMNEEHPDEGTS